LQAGLFCHKVTHGRQRRSHGREALDPVSGCGDVTLQPWASSRSAASRLRVQLSPGFSLSCFCSVSILLTVVVS
jgi:hypothetical protein